MHFCSVCFQPDWEHPERCEIVDDCYHWPALCCRGCGCLSFEEMHPELAKLGYAIFDRETNNVVATALRFEDAKAKLSAIALANPETAEDYEIFDQVARAFMSTLA